MEIEKWRHTTITCSINLLQDERFAFSRSLWARTYQVDKLTIERDHFKMFYHDKRGALRSIKRDRYIENVHFYDFDAIPDMPEYLKNIIKKTMDELREEYRFANPPSGMFF